MELFSVDARVLRSIFTQTLVLMALAIMAGFILLNNGYFILRNFDPRRQYTWPILLAMILLSVIYTFLQKQKLNRIFNHKEFSNRVKAYEKLYRFRMGWHLFACSVACFL